MAGDCIPAPSCERPGFRLRLGAAAAVDDASDDVDPAKSKRSGRESDGGVHVRHVLRAEWYGGTERGAGGAAAGVGRTSRRMRGA